MTHVLRTAALLAFVAAAVSCEPTRRIPPPSPSSAHVTAATLFTRNYAQSKLARWNVRAAAAGSDCGVLFVQTTVVMDDSMVEALHYGAGAYRVAGRGVDEFSREHSFRGVAYRDPSEKVWTYGNVSTREALTPCR